MIMMTMFELKEEFSKLGKKLEKPNVNINLEINSTYGKVTEQLSDDLTKVANRTFEGKNKEWNKEINKFKKDKKKWPEKRDKLINKKIKGKDFKNRLNRDKRKLTNDIIEIKKKKEKKILTKTKQFFKRTRRIFLNEKHRIVEGSKNITYKIIKPLNIRKEWNCMFINSRHTHQTLHKQISDENGLFWSESGYSSEYPGGFGIAKEDCNCKCKIRFIRKDEENG